jgi:predicted dehydrogenase
MNLRVVIAGAGFIGAVHARSARLAGARLFGLSASNAERAAQAAARLSAVKVAG